MESKSCDICHQERRLDLFGKNRSKKDGLHSTCKECKRRLDKEYSEKNKDKISEQRKQKYVQNREVVIAKVCEYARNNRGKCNKLAVATRKRLKTLVLGYYAGGTPFCRRCPEVELELLTIDHIDGGGNKHRKSIGVKSGGNAFYHWLKNNDFPDGFQVLCWNCQYRKRRDEMTPPNRNKRQLQLAANNQRVKMLCLEKYGAICPCGETDPVVLTLDHVNDDGAEHRRQLGMAGTGFYFHLIRNGFPNDPPLQVLCMKCQYRKMVNNEGKNGQTGDPKSSAVTV